MRRRYLASGRLRLRRVLRWSRRRRLAVVEDACREGLPLVWRGASLRSRDPDPIRPEFLATYRSRHPGLLKALEMGGTRRRRWLLREWVEGMSLSETHPPRDPFRMAAILTQVCDALADLHDRGWCHGAVRREHVIVEHRDDDEIRVRLVVPGSVRRVGDSPRVTRVADLAPEELSGAAAAVSLDQHGLGRLAYELLTGRSPSLGRRAAPPSRIRSDLPPEADAVVLRMLAADPQDRFKSVRESGDALWSALGGRGAWRSARGGRAAFRSDDMIRTSSLDWLTEVRRHGRGAVAIRGRPGTGKRALLRRLSESVQAANGVWIPASRSPESEEEMGALARRLAFELAEVREEVPEGLHEIVGGHSGPESGHVLVDALESLGRRRKAVLVLEGVDRWERQAGAWIEEVIRRTQVREGMNAVVILTADAAAGAFERFAEAPPDVLPTLSLTPLEPEELTRALERCLQPESLTLDVLEGIQQRTGGLPELVARLLGDLAVSGRARPGAEGWLVAPQVDPREVPAQPEEERVDRRISGISPDAHRTLDCLSILRGQSLPPPLMNRALGRGWSRGLEELVDRGLVLEEDGLYRFVESETPLVVNRRLDATRKQELNHRMARALEPEARAGRHLAAYAHHLREAKQRTQAIYATVRAAEEFEQRGQLAAAGKEYAALLVLLRGKRDDDLRQDVLLRFLQIKIRLGELRRCEALYAHLIRLARERGDEDETARLTIDYGEHLIGTRRFDKCREVIEQAVEDGIQEDAALAVRAKLALFTADLEGARAGALGEARALRKNNTVAATAVLRSVEAILNAMSGKYGVAKKILRSVAVRCREHGQLRRVADALHNRGMILRIEGRPHSAGRMFQKALMIYRTHGSPDDEGDCHAGLASTARSIGRPSLMREHWERAKRLARWPNEDYRRIRHSEDCWPWTMTRIIMASEDQTLLGQSTKRHIIARRAQSALSTGEASRAARLYRRLLSAPESWLVKKARVGRSLALSASARRGVPQAATVRKELRGAFHFEALVLPERDSPILAALRAWLSQRSHSDRAERLRLRAIDTCRSRDRSTEWMVGKMARRLGVAERGGAGETLTFCKGKLEVTRGSSDQASTAGKLLAGDAASHGLGRLRVLRRALKRRIPCVIWGPTGSGKSEMVANGLRGMPKRNCRLCASGRGSIRSGPIRGRERRLHRGRGGADRCASKSARGLRCL
jgi:tetratricopeptide (TPR) repeat protein